MNAVLFNRHSELRSGWKVLLFIVITFSIITALTFPFQYFDYRNDFVGPMLGLAGALAGSYAMTRFVNRKPLSAIGLSFHYQAIREFYWGCILGFLMISGIFAVMYLGENITLVSKELSFGGTLGIVSSSLLFFAIGAVVEEVLFRGYPFQSLIQGITILPAMIIMAVLFALLHLSNPNTSVFGIINVGLAAIWLSFAYLKTRGLWLPFGLHLGWNYSQTTIYSFPTSGIEFEERTLAVSTITGPEWFTGGAFGPEGGVLATCALVLCTWYILKSKRFSIPEGIVTLDSVEDLLRKEGRLEGQSG